MAVTSFTREVLEPFRAYVDNNQGLKLDTGNNIAILEVTQVNAPKVSSYVLESQFTSRKPGTLGQRLVNASREETSEFYNLAIRLHSNNISHWKRIRSPWLIIRAIEFNMETEDARLECIHALFIAESARREVARKSKPQYELPAHIKAQRVVELQPIV